MHFEFEPHVERIGEIRHAVRDELGTRCSEDLRGRIELVLSELLTNAVAASPRNTVVVLDVSFDGTRAVISVQNTSASENPPVPAPPSAVDPTSPRGRGLMIADTLATAFDVDERGSRVTVTAVIDA
jgi:anti-sigma regulatory factor (Ser/Thr protein kinase)